MIPSIAHFVWYGQTFPWVNALAIRSALARGGFDKVILHHEDDLRREPAFRLLRSLPRLETRPIHTPTLFRPTPYFEELWSLHREMTKPAARSNMVRAALLWSEGGVYLDFDTITVADLSPLREAGGLFCGEERVVFPAKELRNKKLSARLHRLALTATRDALRRLPGGWRQFRTIEDRYYKAVNNAVLGAEPGHPLIAALLERMARMPEHAQFRRFALGTHLLQDELQSYEGEDVTVYPPEVFYPLGPEISQHWFRFTKEPPPLGEVVLPETKVVHWYASVRTRQVVPEIDPEYVQRNRKRQLFSALAAEFLP